jgi:hypothetical protein
MVFMAEIVDEETKPGFRVVVGSQNTRRLELNASVVYIAPLDVDIDNLLVDGEIKFDYETRELTAHEFNDRFNKLESLRGLNNSIKNARISDSPLGHEIPVFRYYYLVGESQRYCDINLIENEVKGILPDYLA